MHNTFMDTVTVGGVPVALGGASAAVLADARALLESSREWIQLEAPCLKSLSSSAVSLRTMLSVLTFSICASVCGSLPGEGVMEEEEEERTLWENRFRTGIISVSVVYE